MAEEFERVEVGLPADAYEGSFVRSVLDGVRRVCRGIRESDFLLRESTGIECFFYGKEECSTV